MFYNNWKKTFYSIVCGEMVSTIGSSAVQFSLIWRLTDTYKSVNIMVIAALFTFLPNVLFGPIAGGVVDKIKRKYVIIISDLFSGILAIILAVTFYYGVSSYIIVCVALGLRAIASSFQIPAIQATIPVLVPKKELAKANSFSQFIESGCNLFGPVLGSIMITSLPIHFILMTDLIGAIIACLVIYFASIPEIDDKDKVSASLNILENFKIVFRFIKNDFNLSSFIKVFFICTTLYMPLGMLFPLMIKQTFNGSSIVAGGAQFLYTFGMLIASILLGIYNKRIINFLSISKYGLTVFGFSLLISGLLPENNFGSLFFLVLCFFMGIGVNICNIPFLTYLQYKLPKIHQGKIMSFYQTLISLAMPLGLIITTPANNFLTIATWFSISGCIMLISLLINFVFMRKYHD